MLTKPETPRLVSSDGNKTVLYWMSRDQRVGGQPRLLLPLYPFLRHAPTPAPPGAPNAPHLTPRHARPLLGKAEDNWAALHARSLAEETGGTMAVAFSLVPSFLGATYRHFHFMLKGLQETEQTFREKRVPFHLVRGQAVDTIPALAKELNVAAVVTDFCPLRVPAAWASAVAERLDVLGIPLHQVRAMGPDVSRWCHNPAAPGPSHLLLRSSFPQQLIPPRGHAQVDAHNVVPAWVASPKQETAARTFRPKITALLPRFLQPFPPLAANEPGTALPDAVDWEGTLAGLQTDMSVGVVAWCKPGAAAGAAMLHEFAQKRLSRFSTERNDPNKDALSNLSPWIHFGQLSVQAAVLTLKRDYKGKAGPSMKTFVEEAVVRRELADNYCFYQPNYDTLDGAAGWARETLQMHAKDQREYVYSREELEAAQTHDDLWNAAQVQVRWELRSLSVPPMQP